MAKINQTNLPDWSALIPVLPTAGTRARAVYAALRGLIEDGRLPPGAKLPPSRALAQQWGLARGAVVAGFEMLVADGFAVAQVGAGTFVAPQVPRAAVVAVSAPRAFVPMDLPGDLGLGFPDPLTLRQFRVILNRHLSRPIATLYHYADPQGDRALRAEVAQYLQVARGLRLHPDQVVLTSGTQGALDLVARAVLAPGDEVWMEDPGYPSGKAALVAQRLIPVPVDAEGLDVRAGIARAPGARAAYVTPSHQFPLGVAMTMPRRLELLAWADQIGGWIIEDDYDSEFRFTGAPLAALQGIDAAGRVIYVGTFSKALMPGLRVGYLVLPEALLGPVIDLRRRTDRAPPALGDLPWPSFSRRGISRPICAAPAAGCAPRATGWSPICARQGLPSPRPIRGCTCCWIWPRGRMIWRWPRRRVPRALAQGRCPPLPRTRAAAAGPHPRVFGPYGRGQSVRPGCGWPARAKPCAQGRLEFPVHGAPEGRFSSVLARVASIYGRGFHFAEGFRAWPMSS
ncbi:PLP-dependent aminotransferase family protein [Gemmobacter lanyuensis]